MIQGKAEAAIPLNSVDEDLKVYKFIIATTLLVLVVFAIKFLVLNAWFPFAIVTFGATIMTPLCWYIANNGNHVSGRVLFNFCSATYVCVGSIACNNQIDAQYFFIATATASIVQFSATERRWSYSLICLILFYWFMTQIDASHFLPEHMISTNLPITLIKNLTFTGSLLLTVTYLVHHAESIRRQYTRIQKQTEELGKQQANTLSLLTKISNNVPGAVYQFRISADGKASFPYSSLGMEKIFRLNPKQLAASADEVLKCLHPEDVDQVTLSVKHSAETLSPWQCDYRVKFDDGAVEWRRGIAQPQREADGSTLWHGFIMDVTNEKNLHLDLEQSQRTAIHAARLASLGEMAGGIAHEINNPLMIITGKTSSIQRLIKSNNIEFDRIHTELEKIKQTTYRIAKIVKGLLTFARDGEQVEFQIFSVEDMFNDVSSLCGEKAKANGIDIQFNSEKNLFIFGNSLQISQVILNLINNSIDATSSHSTRWIKIEAKVVLGSDQIRFSVTDSGLGIDKQQIGRLMQPFFTTKSSGFGTGLGLSISKGLIENHGGNLVYDIGSPNTRFYFDLKCVEALAVTA